MDTSSAHHPAAGSCSFCGKPRDQVSTLTLGQKLSICGGCVETASRCVLTTTGQEGRSRLWQIALEDHECNFCGKPRGQVWRLLSKDSSGYICSECLELANDIICEESLEQKRAGAAEASERLSSELRAESRKHGGGALSRLGSLFRRHR